MASVYSRNKNLNWRTADFVRPYKLGDAWWCWAGCFQLDQLKRQLGFKAVQLFWWEDSLRGSLLSKQPLQINLNGKKKGPVKMATAQALARFPSPVTNFGTFFKPTRAWLACPKHSKDCLCAALLQTMPFQVIAKLQSSSSTRLSRLEKQAKYTGASVFPELQPTYGKEILFVNMGSMV